MKSNKIIFISITLIIGCVCVAFSDEANVPAASEVEKVKAELEAQVWASRQENDRYAPQWQNDFSDLQTQAVKLLKENDRLSAEHQSLQDEAARLQKEIEEGQNKNKAVQSAINDKKTLMDDKIWNKRVAAQQAERQKKIDNKNTQLAEYDRKSDSLEKKIALGQLKLKALSIDDNTEEIAKIKEELGRDRAELEANNSRAAVLKEKLAVPIDEKTLDPAVLKLKTEINALRSQITALEHPDQASRDQNKEPSLVVNFEKEIKALTKQKTELEADLKEIQAKTTKIQNSKKMGITSQRMKELVETMSAVDAENGQLREEVKYLGENIDILKSHIKKLEYQKDSINAMKGKTE